MATKTPPAYQEYPANLLANRNFKMMGLAERGLLYTMRMECWINNSVPSNPDELARYLGLSLQEIELALTNSVKSFFVEQDGEFSCQELDAYKSNLAERRRKQSEGGKAGAEIRYARDRLAIGEPIATQLEKDRLTHGFFSIEQNNIDKSSKNNIKRIALNSDFEPTNESIQWAMQKHPMVDLKVETEKFINHHLAKGSVMADWQRAWMNWISGVFVGGPKANKSASTQTSVNDRDFSYGLGEEDEDGTYRL